MKRLIVTGLIALCALTAAGVYLWHQANIEQARLQREQALANEMERQHKQWLFDVGAGRLALAAAIDELSDSFDVALRTPRNNLGAVLLRLSDSTRKSKGLMLPACFKSAHIKTIRANERAARAVDRLTDIPRIGYEEAQIELRQTQIAVETANKEIVVSCRMSEFEVKP